MKNGKYIFLPLIFVGKVICIDVTILLKCKIFWILFHC